MPPVLMLLAPIRWDGSRQRTQHLAAGLARTRQVIYVEPAAYTLPGLVRRRLAGGTNAALIGRCRTISDRLSIYSPPPTVPGNLHLRSLNSFVHALALRTLRRLRPAGELSGADVVVAWPPSYELARRLKPRRLLYDCLDLFPAFESGLRGRLMTAMEERLSQSADTVIVTSRDLERRWSRRHPWVVRIPNGVDLALFAEAPTTGSLPSDITDLPRPRLGYVGTVGKWVDVALLQHVAERQRNASIVVIGPVERGLALPCGPPNLRWLGERPYCSLPGYLAAMDVLLIPFRVNELTRAVNPIKLYEYCATGKPIVATPLEEVIAEGAPCHLGEGFDAFLKAIDSALLEARIPDPVRTAGRKGLAYASSWEARVAALASVVDRGR
jgi:hypothetical protein